jgi:tetratricopeptide (TPR) repeat protein
MRRDLLVTALVFLLVGFVAGALYTGTIGGSTIVAAPGRPAATVPAPASEELPEGHPPMDTAARWQELRDRAVANPNDEQAQVDLGNFLYDQGVWDQAIPAYQRALEIKPRNADVRTDLATSLFNSSQFEAARREYEAALEQEPDKPQALFGLARVKLEGLQDRAGAERAYEQLRRAHPTFEGVAVLAEILGKGK